MNLRKLLIRRNISMPCWQPLIGNLCIKATNHLLRISNNVIKFSASSMKYVSCVTRAATIDINDFRGNFTSKIIDRYRHYDNRDLY